ncbi:protein ASC1, putative [Entamoeba invadens IP1]|uniref:Protein ASC1, putative n=1 Tax=Entamoeba invadens IP1 TaxID=370355 RepID=A0A0A1U3G7_ENTIV|nr:protein ASC1, putative [Entamoeba invadens IP1]ELP88697.1 protein ASC1, putative [Entamoeba invadens IP1]|eukprot:XP_004255468.1 protein ASC1, putative [Entamoeba invadens IP1]
MKSIPKVNGVFDHSFVLQLFILFPFVALCVPSTFFRSDEYSDYVPSLLDLLPTVFFVLIISGLREVLANNLFMKLGEKFIPHKAEWTEDFRNFRVERFGLTLFKTVYYFIVTPIGFYLFRNEDWMPQALFGQGKSDLNLLWENFPYMEPVKYIAFYYSFELGYHLHSLIYHMFIVPPRNDFYETLLHHLVTVMLIFLSYFNNCARIGVLVMILHDIVDAIMYAGKALNDVANDYVVVTAFSGVLVSYARFRLWVLPRYIIPAAINAGNYIPKDASCGKLIWIVCVMMLVALFGLHVYWFSLILDMVKKLVCKEGIVDPHATKKAVIAQ